MSTPQEEAAELDRARREEMAATQAVEFVRYDPASGEIVNGGSMATRHVEAEIAMGLPTLKASGTWREHYIDLASKTIRDRAPGAATMDGLTLRGLPVPCKIEIAGADGIKVYPHDEPELALSFVHPGRYRVRVMSAAYFDALFEVTAP